MFPESNKPLSHYGAVDSILYVYMSQFTIFSVQENLTHTCILYHYMSQTRPKMEYWCYTWSGAIQSFLFSLDRVLNHLYVLASYKSMFTLQPLSHRCDHRKYHTALSLFLWKVLKQKTLLSFTGSKPSWLRPGQLRTF